MRYIISLVVLLLVVSVAGAQNKAAVGKVPGASVKTTGKHIYMEYCAACHGTSATGDGPAAAMMKTAPPDLTTLAKRHGGKFPYEYVVDVLIFGTRIQSHGSSDMPIWGPIFGSMDHYDELAVRKRIKDLSGYLMSLQQKES